MNSKSLFKLTVLLITWLKVTVAAFPITTALVNLKQGSFQYGYDYFELDYKTAILFAIAIGIVFSVWNAFEHANLADMDEKQFMKAKQRYQLKDGASLDKDQIEERLKKFVERNRRWRFMPVPGATKGFKLIVKNFLGAKDVVTIWEKGTSWMIESRPKSFFDIIDLGRNFKNIMLLSREIQKPS